MTFHGTSVQEFGVIHLLLITHYLLLITYYLLAISYLVKECSNLVFILVTTTERTIAVKETNKANICPLEPSSATIAKAARAIATPIKVCLSCLLTV